MTPRQRLLSAALVAIPMSLLFCISDPHGQRITESNLHLVSADRRQANWNEVRMQAWHPLPGSESPQQPTTGWNRGEAKATRPGKQQGGDDTGEVQAAEEGPGGQEPDGEDGSIPLVLRPPAQPFYTLEGGLQQRRDDAPEDPFTEDIVRWLPHGDQIPRNLGSCAVVGNSATLR